MQQVYARYKLYAKRKFIVWIGMIPQGSEFSKEIISKYIKKGISKKSKTAQRNSANVMEQGDVNLIRYWWERTRFC